MSLMVTRRQLIGAGIGCSVAMAAPAWASSSLAHELEALEHSLDVTLGLWALDTGTGKIVSYRAGERFAFCSTFKVVLAAAILAKSADDKGLLDRRITYCEDQLVVYSPVTEKHVGDGMTVSALCAATLQYSDNTAGNILLEQVGGPVGLTAFARNLGDPAFRLDRNEPELNTALPDDPRDTTTPLAMGMTLQKLLLGNSLAEAGRLQLQEWLKGNTTGDKRIRAGVPQGWVVGDKTGSGDYGVANDVAVIWPPGKAPWILVVFTRGQQKASSWSNEAISSSARAVVKSLG
ncbi:class A beta-lactamase [Pseudomonas sichuanensis]|uniref:class A beta-lactamase n=1 Tax=Pseudomonas sichuanensis TaxID=2213015 RepID=UPI00215F5225|nr:class A beta-lactamase [Pseudomonas sichuanensis]UVL89457.1 class A beta-lactamase [Pseudomonas sichuanensis]